MLIATPVFITNLGIEQYGIWMLINTIIQTMNVLNLGIGDSTIRLVSVFHARADQAAVYRTVNQNLSIAMLLVMMLAFAGLLLGRPIILNLFNIPETLLSVTSGIIFLGAISAGLKFTELVIAGVFKGFERFDYSARLSLLSRNSVVLVNIAVVLLTQNLLYVFVATVAVNLINLVVQFVTLKKFLSGYYFSLTIKLKEIYTEWITYHFWYWLQSVIALLGFLSDRIIIGYLADLKTVGYYSIAALIGSQIHNVLLAFGGFVFPKLASYHEVKKDISNVYKRSRMMIAGLGWAIILTLLLGGDILFKLWLGDAVYLESIGYIKLYLAFSAVILLIIIPFHFINASTNVKLNSLFEFLLRGTHVVAMLLAYSYGGMTGLLLALICTTIIHIPFQYYLFNKQILGGQNVGEAFLPLLPALAIVGLAVTTILWLKMVFLFVFIMLFWKIYVTGIQFNNVGKAR